MNRSAFKEQAVLILTQVGLWLGLLIIPFTERTLLAARTYYGLFAGLALVFVIYGLTIRNVFFFLRHRQREPFYIWIAYLLWSVLICFVLSVFAFQYDLLPHLPTASQGRQMIDYLYYEVITFTTVGYGDITPNTAEGKILAMCTALLGATHGVTFVAIVFYALGHKSS